MRHTRKAFVLLHGGVPHGFAVSRSGPAHASAARGPQRFVHLPAPGRFDQFPWAVGEPTAVLEPPAGGAASGR